MDLKEATKKKQQLKNDLKYYRNQRELNLQRVGVGAVSYDKELVQGGEHKDKFTNYLVSLEDKNKLTLIELDRSIAEIQQEIDNINAWISTELAILRQYKDKEQLVIHYRLNEGCTWVKTARLTGYSARQCQRIVEKYKKN